MSARLILKGLALILSLALLGYLFHTSELGSSVNEAWIDAKVRDTGAQGIVLFLVTGAIFTAFGLPRQVIALLGGYAFNLALGTLLGALAALLGCILAFGYARLLGRSLLRPRLRGRAEAFDSFAHDNPFSMTLLLRLLPVGSNLVINLAAGITSIRPLPFFAGSALGYLPQTLVFALVGSGLHVSPLLHSSLAIALFVLSGVFGTWLYQRFRHHPGLPEPAAFPSDGSSGADSRQ